MPRKLLLRDKARTDLFQIGRYTEQRWGRSQRNHYLRQFDEAFQLILENPQLGKDRSHVLPGYRSFQQGAHVIFYKQNETLEIVRILHKRMDVASHIK